MDEVVKAMARLGVHKDAATLRSWGLHENSTGYEIRVMAMEYKDFINS